MGAHDVSPTDPVDQLIEVCAAERIGEGDGQQHRWWNDFLLGWDVTGGEPPLLAKVAELLLKTLPERYLPDIVLPANPDALPLATAIHLANRKPIAQVATTRLGQVWFTPKPPLNSRVLVVDALLRSGDSARHAARLLRDYGEARFAVIADFSDFFGAQANARIQTGWEGRLTWLLKADRDGWIRGRMSQYRCQPIDDATFVSEVKLRDILSMLRRATRDVT